MSSYRSNRGGFRGRGGFNRNSSNEFRYNQRRSRSPEFRQRESDSFYDRRNNRENFRDREFESRNQSFDSNRFVHDSDFRNKRKFHDREEPFPEHKHSTGYKPHASRFREQSPSAKRFQYDKREFRGFGFRARGDSSRPFVKHYTRDERADYLRERQRDFDTSRFSRVRMGSERKNISDMLSDIRHRTSPRASKEDSAKKLHSPTKEEKELEDQVIDEKLYQSMSIDQRDYVASKVLRILVTKQEGRCTLSELEYELMDIKIMFVSSELFLEFLQSFIHDDNIFEVIEPNEEDELSDENKHSEAEAGEKNDSKEDTEKKIKTENTEMENKTEDADNSKDDHNEDIEKESNHLEKIIVVGRPKLQMCTKYINNIYACGGECQCLHVCKFHIFSKCNAPDGKVCCFHHTLDNTVNQKCLRLSLLHTFTMDLIKKMLKKLEFRNPSTLPPICWHYNSPRGCHRQNCTFLHMCSTLLKGETCSKEKKCKLNHDLLSNSEVLTRFGLWSPEYRVEDLLKCISKHYVEDKVYAGKSDFMEVDNSSGALDIKGKWQLYIPSDEMWMDLTETCHKELESKHRAVVRAKAVYEQAKDEMKHFKVSTLIGERKKIPEITNKILRRLSIDEIDSPKKKEKPAEEADITEVKHEVEDQK